MRAAIRRMGHSNGGILPKPILVQLGMTTGDVLDLSVEEGRLVLVPVVRRPREGWAEDAGAYCRSGR